MADQGDYEDPVEVIEKYVVLLLGVVDEPVPSIIHLEKELFILSKANPNVGRILKFVPHSYGPYSDVVRNIVEDSPLVDIIDGKLMLSTEGRKVFKELVEQYGGDPKFKAFLESMRMIRRMYDKLTTDELLFLIYLTYPEYRKESTYYEKLFKKRREIASSLLRKGYITERRYSEIVEEKQ